MAAGVAAEHPVHGEVPRSGWASIDRLCDEPDVSCRGWPGLTGAQSATEREIDGCGGTASLLCCVQQPWLI